MLRIRKRHHESISFCVQSGVLAGTGTCLSQQYPGSQDVGCTVSVLRHPCLRSRYSGPWCHPSETLAGRVVHSDGNEPSNGRRMAAGKSLGIRERARTGVVTEFVRANSASANAASTNAASANKVARQLACGSPFNVAQELTPAVNQLDRQRIPPGICSQAHASKSTMKFVYQYCLRLARHQRRSARQRRKT